MQNLVWGPWSAELAKALLGHNCDHGYVEYCSHLTNFGSQRLEIA